MYRSRLRPFFTSFAEASASGEHARIPTYRALTRRLGALLLLIVFVMAAGDWARASANERSHRARVMNDAQAGNVGPCDDLTAVAARGPTPEASVLALRWLGTTNFELAYGRTVVLLDAYYDRGPRNRPIGVSSADITRADLILIGHGHFDHIADAAAIAKRTGAVVVGAPLSIQVVLEAGLPRAQTRTVTGKGGELLRFPDFTVEPVLAQHSVLSRPAMAKFDEMVCGLLPPPTEEVLEDDALAGYFPDLGVEPLFMAVREELPGTKTIAPLYRTPICLKVP
jgi:hypothetical protein